MKKLILAVVTAIIATGSLAAHASAVQGRSDAHASSSIFTNNQYADESPKTGLFVGSSVGIQPIPGSITYGGQPMTRLTKSPVGTSINHEFTSGPNKYAETYVLQSDRSLKLVSRKIRNQN